MTTRAQQTAAQGPVIVHRAAELAPASFDPADNSLEVVWTTGAPVERSSFFGGQFIETLDVSARALRLERLNAGAAVLDSHNMYELGAALGSVVPGSVRVAGGRGTARIRLSDAGDVADTVSKIRDGHLRSVSVGYFVHTYERLTADGNEPDELRAIDWEPVEISFVSVPADPGAQVRLEETDMTRIIDNGGRRTATRASAPAIINREGGENQRPAHDIHGEQDGGDPARRDVDPDRGHRPAYRGQPRPRDLTTVERIRSMCDRGNLSRDFERGLLDQHAEDPLTEAQMLRAVSDELCAARGTPHIDARADGPRHNGIERAQQQQRNLFAEALYARLANREPVEAAREYTGASLVDMGRALLEARGERVRWMRAGAVVDAITRHGQHTSSDFGYIISNAGRRYLVDAFNAAPSPLKTIARKRDFPDFKTRYGVQAEGPGGLRYVGENGEFKRVSMNATANGMQLYTYGEIFAISRQAIINDDLSVFTQMGVFWARALAGTEAGLLAGFIAGNGAIMGEDGKTLYHADHGNIASVAAGITVTSLSAARQQMRTLKNRDGVTPADVVPKYLVVGPAKETEGEQVLAALQASAPSEVNPFAGKLELIVDSRLLGNSWRLFADPAAAPVLEYGNLEGQDGLFTDTRIGFDVDGVEFKARTDLGGGAVDWRGTLLNPGN